MARKSSLQPTYQTRQTRKLPAEVIFQPQHVKGPSESYQSNNQLPNTCQRSHGAVIDEIEIISEDDLPTEDQPEDGELSEIRSVYHVNY